MGNCIDLKNDNSLGINTKITRTSSDLSSCSPKLLLSDFRKKKVIGTGTISQVYLVERTSTGKNYAMKVMEKSRKYKKDTKDIRGERMILEKLRNPFLVTMHYAFQTGYTLHLVLELANGGDLYNRISCEKQLPEDH